MKSESELDQGETEQRKRKKERKRKRERRNEGEKETKEMAKEKDERKEEEGGSRTMYVCILGLIRSALLYCWSVVCYGRPPFSLSQAREDRSPDDNGFC